MKRSFWIFLLVLSAGCAPKTSPESGADLYAAYCSSCHQPDGKGIRNAFPPLTESVWVQGDEGRLIRLVLRGMQGPIVVQGEPYNNVMTPHRFLSDEQVAAVLTLVRSSFGNEAPPVEAETVARVRKATPERGLWQASELEGMLGVPK
ncbi:MAG: cytochrome C [Bacteroidetes bacterium CG12_big_fil_rev_8_21_14_0_65_60_17]|nr:MAG: cytochrome C [Bacteroidetes bacterium CG12_big_fil_rev_8_21_14_0_65_60_17]